MLRKMQLSVEELTLLAKKIAVSEFMFFLFDSKVLPEGEYISIIRAKEKFFETLKTEKDGNGNNPKGF